MLSIFTNNCGKMYLLLFLLQNLKKTVFYYIVVFQTEGKDDSM